MKSKIASHIIACIVGTLFIFGLLKLESFIYRIRNESFSEEMIELAEFMISDTLLLFLFFIIFALVQIMLVSPVFSYLTKQGRLNKQNLVYTWLGLSLLTGILFGLFFGSSSLGIQDFLKSIGIGVAVFLVYYLTSFITYFKLVE